MKVSVEGELGTIGQTGTSVEGGVSKVTYTDPAQAEDFIARTGADTLARMLEGNFDEGSAE